MNVEERAEAFGFAERAYREAQVRELAAKQEVRDAEQAAWEAKNAWLLARDDLLAAHRSEWAAELAGRG